MVAHFLLLYSLLFIILFFRLNYLLINFFAILFAIIFITIAYIKIRSVEWRKNGVTPRKLFFSLISCLRNKSPNQSMEETNKE